MDGSLRTTSRPITKPILKDRAKEVGRRLLPPMFYQSSRSAATHPESALQPHEVLTASWNLCGRTMDKTLIRHEGLLSMYVLANTQWKPDCPHFFNLKVRFSRMNSRYYAPYGKLTSSTLQPEEPKFKLWYCNRNRRRN